IAQQIVAAIGATLSTAERQGLTAVPTANAEAYQLYLQSREYALRPGYLRKNLEIAQELCQRALTLDPEFALAHATLAEIHGGMYWARYDRSRTRALRMWEEAETAVRLAPDLPQAHVALGLAHYWDRSDYRRALEVFVIALKQAPNNAFFWMVIGNARRRLGNWNEAITAYNKAMQLNPRDANLIHDGSGGTYAAMHRYGEAVTEYDRALRLAPDLYAAAKDRGWAYVRWLGRLDTVRALYRRLPQDRENSGIGYSVTELCESLFWQRQADSLLQVLEATRSDYYERQELYLRFLYAAWAYEMRGDRVMAAKEFKTALTLLDSTLRELPEEYHLHAARGLTLAGLGRRDEALTEAHWLQQSNIYSEDALLGPNLAEYRAQILAQVGEVSAALEEIEGLLTRPSQMTVHTLELNPLWNPIRDDPRFKEVLRKYARH
ncbi:tetratricopeptide repeat protein, partial [bacterium]|nr:tetratricopeptide repeat protein [bacterium]